MPGNTQWANFTNTVQDDDLSGEFEGKKWGSGGGSEGGATRDDSVALEMGLAGKVDPVVAIPGRKTRREVWE